jgi:hypothetical protein
MSVLLSVMLLLSIICVVWGLVSPSHIANTAHIHQHITRRHIIIGGGSLILVLFILIGLLAPKTVTLRTTNTAVTKHAKTANTTTLEQPKNGTTSDQITQTQPIAFSTVDENDSNLAAGQTQIGQPGQNGIDTLTYKVVYINGIQAAETLVSKLVTTQPVNQIVENGTYIASAPQEEDTTQSAPSTAPVSSSTSCTPISNEGTCYEPGEYCRETDHGDSGTAGDGKAITCKNNDGWRWEPN